MTNHTEPQPLDSFDYCIEFWRDALDAEDEIDHFVREAKPRHVRAGDDLA